MDRLDDLCKTLMPDFQRLCGEVCLLGSRVSLIIICYVNSFLLLAFNATTQLHSRAVSTVFTNLLLGHHLDIISSYTKHLLLYTRFLSPSHLWACSFHSRTSKIWQITPSPCISILFLRLLWVLPTFNRCFPTDRSAILFLAVSVFKQHKLVVYNDHGSVTTVRCTFAMVRYRPA